MGLSEERWLQAEEESSKYKGPAARTHLECGENYTKPGGLVPGCEARDVTQKFEIRGDHAGPCGHLEGFALCQISPLLECF